MEHDATRLYIGKNHDEKGASVPVRSIFRLAGSNEDALTYALGFLLARDPMLCVELVRLCGVKAPQSFKHDYAVHLQEVTDPRYGRRDIVIEAGKVRIVLEAKIGRAEPAAEQFLKYAKDNKKWEGFTTGVVVSLTQGKLSSATQDEVVAKLPSGICFSAIQWHQVIELALKHRPTDGSAVSRYLFDEFIRYIRGDYSSMNYYDAEIMIQDMNPYNAKMFEKGWVQLIGFGAKKAPMYFAPYFTQSGKGSPLHFASARGNKRIAKDLLYAGADVNARNGDNGSTPLHWGIEDPEIVRLLIENGADVQAKNDKGLTPCGVARVILDAPSPEQVDAIRLLCQ